jgi:hypothetical protein
VLQSAEKECLRVLADNIDSSKNNILKVLFLRV